MKLSFITREAVDALESAIATNLPSYRAGHTAALVAASNVRESRVDVEQSPTLIGANGEIETDAIAARRIFQWLQKLDATQASDARLWTYLTHVTFADYVHKRWVSGVEGSTEPEARALERWFFRGEGSATFFRNGISRLWWFGHVTYDATLGDHFEMTNVLLSLQDIQVAFLERSLGRCRPLLRTVLEVFRGASDREDLRTGRGDKIQRWARELNKVGGAYVLDALPSDRLRFVVQRQLERAMTGS